MHEEFHPLVCVFTIKVRVIWLTNVHKVILKKKDITILSPDSCSP